LRVKSSQNCEFLLRKRTKPEKTRKKPVETKENPLTTGCEKLIVNCGTYFRTRINTGDFAFLDIFE